MPIQPRNRVERALFAELWEICGSGTWETHNGGSGQPGRGFKVFNRDDRIRVIHQGATKVSWDHDVLIVNCIGETSETLYWLLAEFRGKAADVSSFSRTCDYWPTSNHQSS